MPAALAAFTWPRSVLRSREESHRAISGSALTALAASACGVHFAEYRYRFTPPDAHVSGPVRLVVVGSDRGHVNVRPAAAASRSIAWCNTRAGTRIPGSASAAARGHLDVTGGVTGDTDSGVKDTSGVPTDPNATSRITLRTGSGALTLKPTGGTPTGPSPN